MKKVISLILSVLMITAMLAMQSVATADTVGTDYYIDAKGGNDENSGTSATDAWASIAAVNNHGDFAPGDRILFKRGSQYKGILCPKGSGTEEAPITLGAYGDEDDSLPYIKGEYMPTGIFDGEDEVYTNPADKDAAIYLYNQSHWIIENLEVTNTISGTGEQYCIYIGAGDWQTVYDVTIQNCNVHGSAVNWSGQANSNLGGIIVTTRNYSGNHDGINIINNTVKDCKADGIVVFGSTRGSEPNGAVNAWSTHNVYIANNFLSNIGSDGILVNNCNTPIVEYNTAHWTHSFDTAYCVAIWAFACKDALFQYNESYLTQPGGDAQGFDCDYQCTGTTFQYNYSHDNAGGFMLICTEPTEWSGGVAFNIGSVVRYNISQNDRGSTFGIMGHIENTWIYNNTIYTTWTSTGSLFAAGTKNGVFANNTHILNNLFYADSGMCIWQTMRNTTVANNMIYGNAVQWFPGNGDYQLAEGEEYVLHGENNIHNMDPKLNNPGGADIGFESCDAYLLREDSPAIDAGVYVENPSAHPCKTDFFGNSIEGDTKPNIGADNSGTLPADNDFPLYGGQYKKLTDWESVAVGTIDANITLLNGNTTTWSSVAELVDNNPDGQNLTGLKDSTRAIKVTGKYDSDHAIALSVPAGTFSNATGLRFWANGGGADRVAKIIFSCSDGGANGYDYTNYQAVSHQGGWVYVDFNNSDFIEEWNGRPDNVNREYLKNTSFIKIQISCGANQYFYIDDIQVCVGGVGTDFNINEDGELRGVAPDTDYADFVSHINATNGGEYSVLSGEDSVTSGNIATGMTLKVKAGDGVAEYTVIIDGDVSGDGSVSSQDLLKLKRAALGLEEFDKAQSAAGDLLENDKINAGDCLKLKRILLAQ